MRSSEIKFWKDFIVKFELPLPLHLPCFNSLFFKAILWEALLKDLAVPDLPLHKHISRLFGDQINLYTEIPQLSNFLLNLEDFFYVHQNVFNYSCGAYAHLYERTPWDQIIWNQLIMEIQTITDQPDFWNIAYTDSLNQELWYWFTPALGAYQTFEAKLKAFKPHTQKSFYEKVLFKKKLQKEALKSYLEVQVQDKKILNINPQQNWLVPQEDNEAMGVFKSHRSYDLKPLELKNFWHLQHDQVKGESFLTHHRKMEKLNEFWIITHESFNHLKGDLYFELSLYWNPSAFNQMERLKQDVQDEEQPLKWSDMIYTAFIFYWKRGDEWVEVDDFAVFYVGEEYCWKFNFKLNNDLDLWGASGNPKEIKMMWNPKAILHQYFLWNTQLDKVKLHVEMKGFNQLNAQSPSFEIITNQLFYPFGPQPTAESYFKINFDRLGAIYWEQAFLDFCWYNFPFQNQTWQQYFRDYPEEMQKAHFQLLIAKKDTQMTFPLFQKDHGAYLRPISRFDIKALLNGMDPQNTWLRFGVKGPKYLFQHLIYPNLLAAKIKKNLKSKVLEEEVLNEPYTPYLEFIQFEGVYHLNFTQEQSHFLKYQNESHLYQPFPNSGWQLKLTNRYNHYCYLKTTAIEGNQDLLMYFELEHLNVPKTNGEIKIFLWKNKDHFFEVPLEWMQWDETMGFAEKGCILVAIGNLEEEFDGLVIACEQTQKLEIKEVKLQCFPVYAHEPGPRVIGQNAISKSQNTIPNLKKIKGNTSAEIAPEERDEQFLSRVAWEHQVHGKRSDSNSVAKGLKLHFSKLQKVKCLKINAKSFKVFVLQESDNYQAFKTSELLQMKTFLEQNWKPYYRWEVHNCERESLKLSVGLELEAEANIYDFKNQFYSWWYKKPQKLLQNEKEALDIGALIALLLKLPGVKFMKDFKLEHYYQDEFEGHQSRIIYQGQQAMIKTFSKFKILALDLNPELRLFKDHKSYVFNAMDASIESDYLIH